MVFTGSLLYDIIILLIVVIIIVVLLKFLFAVILIAPVAVHQGEMIVSMQGLPQQQLYFTQVIH